MQSYAHCCSYHRGDVTARPHPFGLPFRPDSHPPCIIVFTYMPASIGCGTNTGFGINIVNHNCDVHCLDRQPLNCGCYTCECQPRTQTSSAHLQIAGKLSFVNFLAGAAAAVSATVVLPSRALPDLERRAGKILQARE